MWLGFSKNLGGGFRVGVGTRMFSKSRGASQKEIAKLEKNQFLQKVAEESNSLFNEFLVNNYIEPEYANEKSVNLEELFVKCNAVDKFKKITGNIKEIQETVSKVEFGGNLTGSRKDKLVDLLFENREIVGSGGKGLNEISEIVSQKYTKIEAIFSVALVLALTVLMELIPSENGGLGTSFFAALILSIVFIFPAHYVFKVFAKRSYKSSAVKKMKEVYEIT